MAFYKWAIFPRRLSNPNRCANIRRWHLVIVPISEWAMSSWAIHQSAWSLDNRLLPVATASNDLRANWEIQRLPRRIASSSVVGRERVLFLQKIASENTNRVPKTRRNQHLDLHPKHVSSCRSVRLPGSVNCSGNIRRHGRDGLLKTNLFLPS